MNRLTHALASICKERLLDEKRLVAPSLRAGHAWLDAITRSGQAVVNVRTVTLRGLALELADPELTLRGLRLLSSQGGAIIVDRVMNSLKDSGPGYLTRLTITPALCQSVYASIRDLRNASVSANEIASHAFEQQSKGDEFAVIMNGFMSELEKLGLVDYAGALDLAVARLAAEGPLSCQGMLILIPEDLECSAKERQLLDAFPQETIVKLPVDQPGEFPDGRTLPQSNAELLRWVREPHAAPRPIAEAAPTAEIFQAVGEINEVREVFRRCVARGVRLDEVEILHTDAATYVPLIFETVVRLAPRYADVDDLFVTFEEGIPCRYARPGRALAAWVEWVRGGFVQSQLAAMLQEEIVAPPTSNEDAVPLDVLAGALRSVGIGFGRDRYLPMLDQAAAALETRVLTARADPESDEPGDISSRESRFRSQLKALRAAREVVLGLLALTPGPEAAAGDVLQSAAQFVEGYARSVTQFDNYARRAIVDAIQDAARYLTVDDGAIAFDAWDWLSKLPEEIAVLGSGPRPGCVHVSNVYGGGHSLRKHTFILGLDEGRFPGAGMQDPVILDAERRNLSRDIPTAETRLQRKLDNFARLLARLRGSVTLSYPCTDLVDTRDKFPSQVILNVFRIVSGDRSGDFSALMEQIGPPVSFGITELSKALDLNEWVYSRLCGDEAIHERERLVECCFPHLARGRLAALGRSSPEFSEFDGRLLNPRPDLDPRKPNGKTVSATSLEMLGTCPRRYFFRYVLDIQLPDEVSPDPEQWLSPMDFGTLLHDVLYEFVHTCIGKDWPPRVDRDLDRIRQIARTKADAWRRLSPPPTEAAFQRQLNMLMRSVEIFIHDEAQLTNRTPIYLEASVAAGGDGEGTSLDSSSPARLVLPDGQEIHARARFDRIDRIGDEASQNYVICDYKSGSAIKYEAPDPFHRGRVVQHALYHAVARDRLKQCTSPTANVDHFEYYFPGTREHGLRLSFFEAELAEFSDVVTKLCDIAAAGAFLPTDDHEADCRYCDYVVICGDLAEMAATSRAKLDNYANVELKPLKELRSRG